MNILFVTSNFPPLDGGIAIFNYHICKELFGQGHNVIVIAKNSSGSEDFDNKQIFKIRRLNERIRPTSVETISKVLISTVKENIDIIFFGLFGSSHWLSGVLAKIILKTPYVILVHGTEFNKYFYSFSKIDHYISKVVLRNATAIIANSTATKNLVESHGYPLSRIHIANPGTDIDEFKPSDNINSIKKQLAITDKKVLLSVSRLVRRKGHENVIKALPNVIDKVPNILYIILGKGDEEHRLKALVKDMALDSHVKFVGYATEEEKLFYYQSCDVFVMPSLEIRDENMHDYEGFGIVYVEANACGKPVIGGKSGGVEDAVIDGVTGLLVDPESIEEISRAIRLLNDREYARKLGENGRRRVEKELNWRVVGERLNKILSDIAERYN